MGNRRKPKHPRLSGQTDLPKVSIPGDEKTVLKEVPAILHWGQVRGSSRLDDETIGKALIFDDGSSDIILFDDISDDAKKMVLGAQAGVDHFSLMDEEPN